MELILPLGSVRIFQSQTIDYHSLSFNRFSPQLLFMTFVSKPIQGQSIPSYNQILYRMLTGRQLDTK